jgi:ferric-dicitrate binding protein FerR (iron transport regulator)
MKHKSNESDSAFDRVTAGMRDEEIDPAIINDAATRVWSRLSDERAIAATPGQVEASASGLIEGCADFQSLIPAYLRGQLSEARALLLMDHTHECIPCRNALKQARNGAMPALPAQHKAAPSTAAYATWRWGIAAALVVGFALAAMLVFQRFSDSGAARATVVEAQGAVYLVSDTESRALNVGEEIPRGEKIRTAKDAYAVVRLEDGSLVETQERSELYVSENSQGVTVHLDRGNVIVQAAKQRARHLYVATPDSLVSVTGTIFAVNSGTKGSRISVVEGEVHVNHAGDERVLHPGDQTTTQASLGLVPIKDEIAWSRKAEVYVKLLSELASLRKEVDQKASQPEVRYSSRFLNLLPEGTVLYAALPNLSATLSESHKIMQDRINQNPALREWWEKEQGGGRPGLDQMIGQIREFGEYLGAEIVASAEMNEKGAPDNFLVLSELKNSEGFRPYVEQKIKAINLLSKNGHAVRIIDDPLSSTATAATTSSTNEAQPPREILIWIQNDFFAVAPKLEQLQRLQQTIQSGGATPFAATPFYARISEVYREGAGLVVAADLEKIIARAVRDSDKSKEDAARTEAYRKLGLFDLRHFIVEQKEADGHTQSRASLTFNEGRRGITSWLAAPGPMGALEYVSPDANVATAFVVKEPTALVDDLLGFMETASPGLRQNLKEMEAKRGLNIRDDFAAPLGGEFAFAIDGPILPTPSWKMVFEVYDQARLQQTFERVVEQLNQWAAREGKAGLQWELTDVGGRTFYALKSGDLGLEVHYAYVGGYLVAAPSRALVERAISYRESGYTLLRSPRFTAQLPSDGNANFSAVFYHDLAPLVGPLAERMAKSKSLPEEQQQALKSIGASTPPTLAYAYAQGDRIILASNTEGGPFGLSPSSLLGLPNAFAIQHIMSEAMSGKNEHP